MASTTDLDESTRVLRHILAGAERAAERRREAEADEIACALDYAEACAERPRREGEREQWVQLAGDGTPHVPEFCHLEYAARLGLRPEAGFSALCTALDLRHRFPELWAMVQALSMPVWVAKKVVTRASALTLAQARALSSDLALAWHGLSPTAFLERAKAAVLAITAPRHLSEEEAVLASRHVTIVSSDHCTELYARLSTADGLFLKAQLDRIATELGRAGDASSREVRLSKALGLLASPARSLQVLQGIASDDDSPLGLETEEQRECPSAGLRGHVCGRVTVDPDRLLPRVELVVHVAEEALTSTDEGWVARTSHTGAQLAQTVKQWLGHARVTVRPVLDTAAVMPTSAYEVPGRMRELLELRNPTSVFPHSTRRTRRLDLDHTVPYAALGPPGQTRPDNLGPLTRTEHRAKTFGGWAVTQDGPGTFVWTSPLGFRYERMPDHTRFHRPPPDPPSRAERWVKGLLIREP